MSKISRRPTECPITPLALDILRRCCLVEIRKRKYDSSIYTVAGAHLRYLLRHKCLAWTDSSRTRVAVTRHGFRVAAQHIPVSNSTADYLVTWTVRDRARARTLGWAPLGPNDPTG